MTMNTLTLDWIRKKRDGLSLATDEIDAFIAGVTDGSIPDYQVSAMLMAMFFRGMDSAELAALTRAMVHSGQVIDLSSVDRPKVDKHSTGGVGDKISLPLAPAVAACGAAVPMVSGRGLGHTGGTLDKLESIPGFSITLDLDRFVAQVAELGVAMIGQTEHLAPADRRLYALRDVTATVESVPLIAASIMSKKLAEGIDGLVIDCKAGHGAFMKTVDQARLLAQALYGIGQAGHKRVSVLITDMDAPIGRYVGNALEMVESIEVLAGRGPEDTRELTVRLGSEMLRLAGLAISDQDGAERIQAVLQSGAALELFGRMIEAQGGDRRVLDDPGRLPRAPGARAITAARDGHVQAILAADIGRAAQALGAGRARKEDAVDPGVGIELLARVGDQVHAGQDLAVLIHNDRGVDRAAELATAAFVIAGGEAPARATTRIVEVLR